ncbi:MAG: proprotein convertase P-domain-containing protein [Xanthomonadaceae bacterium]|nr:proprotein convertase P-domain-containing protein [Xanthomonadaceae bacterium]
MKYSTRRLLALALAFAWAGVANAASFAHPDHYEFDATLHAPLKPVNGSWPITLYFDYPAAGDVTAAAWILEAVAPNGRVVRQWHGIRSLREQHGVVKVEWNGRSQKMLALPAGYYTLRLRSTPTVNVSADFRLPLLTRISEAFAAFGDEAHIQSVDVMLGTVAPAKIKSRAALPVGAVQDARARATRTKVDMGSLPFTIYYGNMHSQTNHSDGGTALASCNGSESPQAGDFGPTDAFTMMKVQAGGDFLLASEHNHMYDGSTGTNASANPATANALFASGISAANTFNATNPDFLALYGTEWGVISNGGHLNLINPDALTSWESNSSGQLIGGVSTPKSDYAALYAVMRQRGWIGQFNHPSTSQFAIGGTGMAYSADGAEVMVLTEILNSSAFSVNTTQTETSRSSYTGAWNLLLERGYKVAPATNQDNHCANWGLSFVNRTGVLLPTGTSLNQANFVQALRARRTFAAEDKTGQLVLTANGHVMGETFTNSGPLTLSAVYASTSGQTVQRVQFFEGVPGRNGTVTQLTEGNGDYTFTPAVGVHFYYVLVTQANGLRLWSAPVWVTQTAGAPDTTPPTVSASATGTSGTITLSATAADDVGVTNVEFYIDNVLRGSDASSPYAISFDSSTIANGAHTLTAKAFDATGNSATSSGVSFTVSNIAPVASFTASVSGATAAFTDTSSDADGTIVVRLWNFGDGNTSTATNPSRTYAAAGTYTVTLTVTDNSGLTHTASQAVTVAASEVQSYTNTTDVAITDLTTVYSTINVAGRNGAAPSNALVTVNIVHTYIGDLKVDLIAPDQSVYVLHNRTGGPTDNIFRTYQVNLSPEQLNGNWTLRVRDNDRADVGRIDSWSLTF